MDKYPTTTSPQKLLTAMDIYDQIKSSPGNYNLIGHSAGWSADDEIAGLPEDAQWEPLNSNLDPGHIGLANSVDVFNAAADYFDWR